jgi:uncharacterized protein (DUF305 family)
MAHLRKQKPQLAGPNDFSESTHRALICSGDGIYPDSVGTSPFRSGRFQPTVPSVAIVCAPGLCCEPGVSVITASARVSGLFRLATPFCSTFFFCVAGLFSSALFCPARARQADPPKPVVVQPGAPGAPSRTLPPSTKATLPPRSQADVEFMQGMIVHHAQAVEMTALIASHTENKHLRSLGARISSSQSDEIKFMKRWLAARGEPVSMSAPRMPGMDMRDTSREPMALMPGMLTPEQMEALGKATGAEFDRLFLSGMIQHHNGALTMVKDLFDTAGAGQDAELFNFATDVDTGQRAEIRIMQGMLEKKPLEEKR